MTLTLGPLVTPVVTPNILSRKTLTLLPVGAKAIRFTKPTGTVATTAGQNDGLPTLGSVASSNLLKFVLNQLQPGQKAEFVLFSQATGKVAAVVYFSTNFKSAYMISESGDSYKEFTLEQAKTLIIQTVAIRNESENPQKTDDSAWISRAQTAPATRTFKSVRLSGAPQAMMLAGAAVSGISGLLGGIGQSIQAQQDRDFKARQALLDRRNRMDMANLSANTQTAIAQGNNTASLQQTAMQTSTSQGIAKINNANAMSIARLNAGNNREIAAANNETTLGVARVGAQSAANTSQVNLEIAQGNNQVSAANSERSLEGTKYAAASSLASGALSSGAGLVGKTVDALVINPANNKAKLDQIEEQGKQVRQNMQFQQELLAGGNAATNQ